MSADRRRWLELRARASAPGPAQELLADALLSLGARGVEEKGPWYVAHFEEPADPDAFLLEAREALVREAGTTGIVLEQAWQEHADWAESWKRGLAERRLTDRVVVRPSWVEPGEVREGDVVVVLDPGMAFGTAEHGTTRGCVRLLDRVVRPGDTVLDVGAGSGILAIVAARLGATRVVAIEGDPLACEALADNVERNGVSGCVQIVQTFATSEDLAAYTPVSGVVANLETGLLAPLFDGLRDAVVRDGWLIVSGILAHEWEEVRAALEARGLSLRLVDADGEWRSGLFEREAPAGA